MRGADGNTRKRSLSQSTSEPQSASSTPPVQFTFINQHSDIRSVRDRRIHNPDHRHEIRSHVMRNVRREEHDQGVKRPTGRTVARTKSRDRKTQIAKSSWTSLDCGSRGNVTIKRESPTLQDLQLAEPNRSLRTSPYPTPPMYTPPAQNHFIDPFDQKPATSLGQLATEDLLYYGFATFMPMTFPVEERRTNERSLRHELVMQAKMSNHATFSGFLATIACHRAVLYKHLKGLGPGVQFNSDNIDDDYFAKAHQDAISATRIMSERPNIGKGEADPDFLEACFGLISTTTIVGEFAQARTHLEGVQKSLRLTGAVVPETAAAWLPLADIKAALGMLEKPRLPLPWSRTIIPKTTVDRMLPPHGSPLSRMASSFAAIAELSSPLQTLVRDAWLICYMCDYNARDVYGGLTHQEHDMFRLKSMELEHDLLEYVFRYFMVKKGTHEILLVPPTEEVIRLAILGLLSTISVYILPGCGLGRAMTGHQLNVMQRWFANESGREGYDLSTLKAVTWALFIFTQCAKDHEEANTFKLWLLEMTRRLSLVDWELVETTMFGFLYVPNVMRPEWMRIWDAVQTERKRRGPTPTSVDRAPGRM